MPLFNPRILKVEVLPGGRALALAKGGVPISLVSFLFGFNFTKLNEIVA
jgi:hypothetical protein